MKITNLRVVVTCPGRNFVLVRVETDEPGLYGVGDATLNGRELAVATLLEQHLAPLLIGRDPDEIEDTWQMLFRGSYWRGGPIQVTALSGIDLALWDLKGKRAGLPVYSLLGGRCRRGAMCYMHAAGCDFAEVTDQVIELRDTHGLKVVRAQCALPGIASTYGYGKHKQAGVPLRQDDLPHVESWDALPYLRTIPALFEHLRDKVGFDLHLMHDVHERLTPIQAAQLAKDLEPARLFFLEDPLRPEHKESFKLIRQHSTTPLAMGELFNTRWDCLPLISGQLIDYIRCGIIHAGGITELKKIAAVAESYNVKTAWHGPPDISPIGHAASVHVNLAVPNFGVQEYCAFPEPVHEVMPGMPTLEDGLLNVTDAPGLGADIDLEAAAKYPYQRGYLPMTRLRDGTLHDW